MMAMLVFPVVVAAAGGAGYLICLVARVDPHGASLLAAGVLGAVAATIAWVPLLLVRGARQVAVLQAALASLVIHLMLTLVLAGAAYALSAPAGRMALLSWVLVFYWVLLIAIAILLARAMHAAAPELPKK